MSFTGCGLEGSRELIRRRLIGSKLMEVVMDTPKPSPILKDADRKRLLRPIPTYETMVVRAVDAYRLAAPIASAPGQSLATPLRESGIFKRRRNRMTRSDAAFSRTL